MDYQELYDTLLDATREDGQRSTVALIGPPGTGKTRYVRNYAAQRKLPLITFNPQLDLEEEIGGVWIKDVKSGKVRYSLPPFLTSMADKLGIDIERDPFVLLCDEMDKAREGVLSCLLTLFSEIERRIRHWEMPKGSLLVAAMNIPKRPLPEALVDRLLFVPFPPPEYKPDIGLQFRELYTKVSRKQDGVVFPERPIGSLRAMVALEAWTAHPKFWDEQALRETVVAGLFNQKQVPLVMEHLNLAAPLQNHVRWSEIATPQSILIHLIERLTAATPEENVTILKNLATRADNDATGELARVVDAFLECEDAVDCVSCDPEIRKKGQAAFETAVKAAPEPKKASKKSAKAEAQSAND